MGCKGIKRYIYEVVLLWISSTAWWAQNSTGALRTFPLAVDLGESQDYVPKIDSGIAQVGLDA